MDNFPTCQVCQQHFTLKGPPPYLLPCLHAACATCVTSTAGGVISCSTCQREVNLKETHLQKDVVRQREIFHLTVQHRPSELLCTHEDDGNQAVCWCQECEEFLCEHCQTQHESFKAIRSHSVQEIADIQAGSIDPVEYCSIHKVFPIDMWDGNCNAFVCAKCRRADHAEHDVNYINVASDTSRMEIKAKKKEVQRVGHGHSSLLQMNTKQLDTSNRVHASLKDVISHTFHSLKTMLDQREKELYVSLQKQTDRNKSDLDSKITTAQSNHLRCKVALDYIKKALLYSTKYDLLKIEKIIGETTHCCVASEPPEEPEDLPLPVFQTEDLDNLKSTLSSFGEIATLWESYASPKNQLFKDRASWERADYMTKLEEMENEYKKKLKQLEHELITSKAKVDDVMRQKEEAERDAEERASQEIADYMTKLKEMENEYKKKLEQLEDELITSKTQVDDVIRQKEEGERDAKERASQEIADYMTKLEEMENEYKKKLEQLEDELITSKTQVDDVIRQKEEGERDAKERASQERADYMTKLEEMVNECKKKLKQLEDELITSKTQVDDVIRQKEEGERDAKDRASQERADYMTKLEEMDNEYKKKLKQLEDELITSKTQVDDVIRQKEEGERDAKDRASQERADYMTKLEEMENEYKKKLKQLEDELITSKTQVDDVIRQKEEGERDAKDRASQERADYMTELEETENQYKKKLKQLEDELITSETKVDDVMRQKEEAERDAKEAHEQCTKFLVEKKMMEIENSTHKEAIKSLEKSVEENKITDKGLQTTIRKIVLTTGSTHHLLKTDIFDKSFILQCIHLKYDLDRVNLRDVHIDNNGVLVNKAGEAPRGNTSERFQKYCGTTSTAPLPQTGHPQYMEVVAGVGIDRPLEEYTLVLELGVCREEKMDVMQKIPFHQYCYSLDVFHCRHHNRVCTGVRRDDKFVHHVPDTLPNTVGSHITLHYGMVYDSNRKIIVIIDVKGMEIMKVLDNVNCDNPMWPMFAVYPRDNARISMKLVVGNDIDMTPEKKAMILTAL